MALGRGGWKALEQKPGQAGEIVVSGPQVQRGYLGDPEGEARNKIKDGSKVWHRTGDAGYLDAQGRLFLLGRLQQRVERETAGCGGAWKPSAAPCKCRGVDFAAYLGLPDPALGQGAVLCVESAAPAAALEPALRAGPWLLIPWTACTSCPASPKDPQARVQD